MLTGTCSVICTIISEGTYIGLKLAILVVETEITVLDVEFFKVEFCNRNSFGYHIGTAVFDHNQY